MKIVRWMIASNTAGWKVPQSDDNIVNKFERKP